MQRVWAVILGCVLGVLAIALTFGRSKGTWWSELGWRWLRYRRRSGSLGERGDDPRLVALRELAPDVVFENIAVKTDREIGMGSDGAGWFAVLELESSTASVVRPPVPVTALARLATEAEQSGVVLQVVQGRAATDGSRVLWIALRLDADAVAESMIDAQDGKVDVPGVLVELVRRVGKVLRRRGLAARGLKAHEMIDALARSCDLVPFGRPIRVRESWDAWHTAGTSQVCFWLDRWPDPERGTTLLAALDDLPSARVTVAVLLEPSGEGTNLRCLVRIAAEPGKSAEVCAQAMALAERMGARLRRLDGEHAPAVYASAPSGGGAR
ncbi:type VII secretion protein EccE [Saccharomonospora sp. NPDC046836]|uniref:type VII secretion protein EccE n=1 Tax=Saccharomonospora sp. NPDC046836 TaxID=3156921 RepID=UPI0033E74C54